MRNGGIGMPRDFDDYMSKLTDMWMILNQYVIEIGVISVDSNRKEVEEKHDITNAELMFIHENGSPIRHIPARPVLSMTIEHAVKKIVPTYLKIIEKMIFSGNADIDQIEQQLGIMCMEMQTYAQNIIHNNDGRLKKNAQSTIARKGGDNYPLHDTGQLERSITCHLVHKNLL